MSLAEDPQIASVHARVEEVFADADARRREYLDELVKRGGTCRCGAAVHDASLRVHPGVCGSCTKRGVKPDPELVAKLEELSGARVGGGG